MSTSVGTLTIEMAANIARLKADMDKALSTVDSTMDKIRKSAGLAVTALGAIGAGLSVAAFTGWVRGAIDAADETSKLAQKIGLAVPQVAGLQLAFRQSGLDAGALQTSMSKLSVSIAGGSDAFKAMGISTKNTDGTLKSTRQILGEVADRFQDYEDGAAKTAIAVQVFGKAGADLIPLLNGGSAALDEFDSMAKKLGLTIDEDTAKKAEQFNDTLDLMGQGFKGIATQVAANLLPTLTGLADEFFTTMTEGDRLKDISDLISKALKGVYATAVLVIEVVYTLGKTLMTAGKQFMAVMRGDFSGAVDIGKEYMADLQKDWTTALDRADRAWNTTGSTAVEAMASASRAAKKEAPVVNEETKKMAAEAAKLEEQYKKLIDSIEDKTGTMMLEAQGTTKLTEGQKLALKTMQDLQNGTLKLTDAQKRHLTATLETMLATEAQIAELQELNKTKQAARTLSDKFTDAQIKETDALRDGNVKLMQQNDVLRLGAAAVRAREIAVLRSTATDLEFAAASVEGNEALAEQARLLRQRADLMEENTVLEEAKLAAEEWKKTSESIESSLTDALMRGFESGKDFGKNLADTLVNMFKTLVLRPIIQPIAQGASNMVLQMMGISLPGSTGGGGGGAGTMMQGLQVSMSQFGGYLGTGFMNSIMGNGAAGFQATQSLFASGQYAQAAGMGVGTLAGYGAGAAVGVTAGRAISDGYAMSGSGNGVVNAGTAAGMILGGPIGAAIGGAIAGAVNRAFGRKQTDIGIEGTLTTAEGIEGQTYRFLKGGWFRSNKTIKESLSSDIEAMFDTSVELITSQTRQYAVALGLPADAIDRFTQEIKLSFQGLTEEEINAKIQETLIAFQEGLTSQYAQALEPLKMAGETFTQTITRLMAIQNVSTVLNEFGGAFSTFATASVTARQNIIDLAGGLDQLVQKTQGFIANFYTREEQAGITARGVVQALEASGFTAAQIAALETRQDFRSLLESIDVSTDIGQQQFVALLDLQNSYANTTTLMEEQGKTLLEIAEAAPQIELLQKMFETDAEYQARVQTAEEAAQVVFNEMLAKLGSVDISISNLSVVMGNGLDRIASSTASAVAAANASAAASAALAQRAIDRADAASAAASAAAAAANASRYAYDGGGFASGGYMTGPALVGEHGPELFDPRTSQVYTAPATSNIFGGAEVAAEIRALRDEVAMMRAETRATAVNTSKIARLQDNWDVRGLTVRTDADQPLDTVAA